MFSQSKLIIRVWESIYPSIRLRSWYGHYSITPVTIKSFQEKQIWLGYIWTLQPVEIDQEGHFMLDCISNSATFVSKLDESTARRQLKSPRPLTGRSIHLTLVTKWSWMTYCHPLCAMSIGPPKFDHENPWSRSCVRSKVKVTFDLQNSKVKIMVKVKHIGHIWGLEFNRYVCFLFCGNRTTFDWDIGNSIFDLENSRSSSWPRSNLMVTFEALSSIDMFAFRFVAIGPFLDQI